MRLSRETRVAYLAMATCLLLRFGSMMLFPVSNGASNIIFTDCRSIFGFSCCAVFVLVWLRLLRYRSIDRDAARCLSWAAASLLLLAFLRAVKQELCAAVALERYLWYAYYLPNTFAPTLLLLGALRMGRQADESLDDRWWLLLLVPAALALLVLTNDLHMLVFRFPGGLGSDPRTWTDGVATRGPLALVPWAWLMVMGVASIVLALVRGTQLVGRHRWWVLLGPLVLGLLYIVIYYRLPGGSMFRRVVQATDVMLILTVAFMECLVRLGFFPSNEGYRELWEASSLRGAIMDASGRVAYAAKGAPQVTPDMVRRASERPQRLRDDDELLLAHPVRGGMAYWVRDLARIHQIKARLAEQGDVLAEERSLLQASNDLAREREAVEQREHIYQALSERAEGRVVQLQELLDELPDDEDAFVRHMHEAVVVAVYLKRCSNLVLAGEGGTVDMRDLALAIGESQEALAGLGVAVTLDMHGSGRLDVEAALAAYGLYQELAEAAPSLGALRVSLVLGEGDLRLGMAPSALGPDELPATVRRQVDELGGRCDRARDRSLVLSLPCDGGGGGAA